MVTGVVSVKRGRTGAEKEHLGLGVWGEGPGEGSGEGHTLLSGRGDPEERMCRWPEGRPLGLDRGQGAQHAPGHLPQERAQVFRGKFHSVWRIFLSSLFCFGRTTLADVRQGRDTF